MVKCDAQEHFHTYAAALDDLLRHVNIYPEDHKTPESLQAALSALSPADVPPDVLGKRQPFLRLGAMEIAVVIGSMQRLREAIASRERWIS